MSSPTSGLSKLSLGKMPTTRGQAALLQSDQQEQGDDEYGSDAAPSHLEYDTGQLTPQSKQRFEAAHEGHFEVTQCGERHGADGSYYVFEIAETNHYSVRIQEPGRNYGNLPCSPCHQGPDVCRHVFWLTDQIARHTLSGAQKEATLTLTKAGYPAEVPDPYRQISSLGIQNLAEEANWQFPTSDPGEDNKRRSDEIREIMAALSPSDVADDYRPDIFTELHDEDGFEQNLVKGDLEATLARMLMTKNDMFHYFSSIVSPNYCASDFFQKMQQKARGALEKMDSYFAAGASSDLTEEYDIVWCADQLTRIVSLIRNRLENLTLKRYSKDEAAKALVYILGEVASRDINMYDGPGWQHSPKRRLPDRERNLYHRLINSPGRTGAFILSDLDLIDANSAHYTVVQLEEIFDMLAAAPTTYKNKFRDLIGRWKSVEGSSGQKRPGEAAASSPKRRMK